MKRNFIYLIGVICLMTSCLGELNTNNPSKDGEIVFSATLSEVKTRTLYDEEGIANSSGAVKVNWVHNDLITVYGSSCTAVPQAEYRVGTVTVDGSNNPVLDANGNEQPVSGQSYANYLQKTGTAGVQWGTAPKSEFYAVYPSTTNTFEETNNGAKVKTTIRKIQKNVFTYNSDRKCWVGRPFVSNVNEPTMVDALMYAYTQETAKDNYVELNFKPWTTVLKFRFAGFNYTTNVGVQQTTVSVRSITLIAPETVRIAGDMDLEIKKDGSAVAAPATENTSNTITIQPDYLPLSAGQPVEFCVYTIPQNNLKFGTDDGNLWRVKIETTDGQAFTYKMRPSSGNADIVAGKIHNVSIPAKQINKPGSLSGSESNWIEKIPRNIYLSELSLPGSWYCTDDLYTGGKTLTDLYDGGIRAFHFNCCAYNGVLKCAGSDGAIRTDENVADYLKELNSLVAKHSKEYIVVVLSIAERADNGSVNPSVVLPLIKNMLADNSLTNLYRTQVGPNTIVKNVSGKMIALVNANAELTKIKTEKWFDNGSALIAEASLAMEANASASIVAGSFRSMQESGLYWGMSDSGLNYYFHHAQGTVDNSGEHPSIAHRKEAIRDIISQSDEIYLNSSHDGWFMTGIGGYIIYYDSWFGDILEWLGGLFGLGEGTFGSATEVANELNPYVLGLVNNKLNKVEGFYPSPLGLVLMNYPLTDQYKGPDLIQAIINMNAAFLLEADQSVTPDTGDAILDIEAGYADVTTWEDIYIN